MIQIIYSLIMIQVVFNKKMKYKREKVKEKSIKKNKKQKTKNNNKVSTLN